MKILEADYPTKSMLRGKSVKRILEKISLTMF